MQLPDETELPDNDLEDCGKGALAGPSSQGLVNPSPESISKESGGLVQAPAPRSISVFPQLRKAQQTYYERKRLIAAHYQVYYSGGLPASTPPPEYRATMEVMGAYDRYPKGEYTKGTFEPRYKTGTRSQRFKTVETFDCGCTEVRTAPVGAKHWQRPDPQCAACSGNGRIRDRELLRQADTTPAMQEDFLQAGGWQINKAGTTGRPVGRPRRGITERDAIYKALHVQAQGEDWRSFARAQIEERGGAASWKDARDALCVLFALTPNLNIAAAARATGLTRKTIYEYRKRGNMLLDEIRQASYEGAKQAIQEAIPDISTRAAIAVHGHPADEAEKILEENERER